VPPVLLELASLTPETEIFVSVVSLSVDTDCYRAGRCADHFAVLDADRPGDLVLLSDPTPSTR